LYRPSIFEIIKHGAKNNLLPQSFFYLGERRALGNMVGKVMQKYNIDYPAGKIVSIAKNLFKCSKITNSVSSASSLSLDAKKARGWERG